MEVIMGCDRYMIMEYVSRQTKKFRFAEIKEKINHATMHPSYKTAFVIAEIEFIAPINQGERERLKKKIAELD